MRKYAVLIFLVVLGTALTWENPTDNFLRDSSLSAIVGQMIMVGFVGTNSRSAGFRDVIHDLEQQTIGGVLFLRQNIVSTAELRTMIEEIRRCACRLAPFIAIDAEGGVVDPVGAEYGYGHTDSPAEIGRGSEEQAREQYGALAQKLDDLGFNMNLAPVVDLNLQPDNPIIGRRGRSYSSSALTVTRFAEILIKEHRARDILTVAKHFPGHGSSLADSHKVVTDVSQSWSSEELEPYRNLIKDRLADAIMIGHLVNNQRWGGVATQEGSTAISQILRKELGFTGVAISDDLTMKGVGCETREFADVVESAVKAGVDLLLIANPIPGKPDVDIGDYVNSALVAGVSSGAVEFSAIERASRRVLALKAKLHRRDIQSVAE